MENLKALGLVAAISLIVSLIVSLGVVGLSPKQAAQVEQKVGAVTGPDIPSPYLQWGGVYDYLTAFDCNSGAYAASSTLFAIRNPSSATSSVIIELITTVGQATTTSLSVGTSTLSTGLALTNVSPTLVNGASIATTTAASIIPSQTTTIGTGQISAGAGTSLRVLVGPSENLVGFATSTATGAGAAGYTPGFTCHGIASWKH